MMFYGILKIGLFIKFSYMEYKETSDEKNIVNEIIIKLTRSEGEGVTTQAYFKSANELESELNLPPGAGENFLKGLKQSFGDEPFKVETIPDNPDKVVIEHPNTNTWSAVPAEYF
jgi:hypothetical protein